MFDERILFDLLMLLSITCNFIDDKVLGPPYRCTYLYTYRSGFRGGGVCGRSFAQGFDPLPTQRVPICTILRYPFLPDGPLNFS